MKVRTLYTYQDVKETFPPGTVIEVDKDEAERLISRGFAVDVRNERSQPSVPVASVVSGAAAATVVTATDAVAPQPANGVLPLVPEGAPAPPDA